MIFLLIIAGWSTLTLLVVCLCAAAGRGEAASVDVEEAAPRTAPAPAVRRFVPANVGARAEGQRAERVEIAA